MVDEGPKRGPFNEWHVMVVSFQGALVTGFIYAFSTYANALQMSLGFDEQAKELIGMAPPICNLITFTCGLLMDRKGVPFCCVLGGVIMACVYGIFGLVSLKVIDVGGSAVPVCFSLLFVGNYGASFIVGGVFSTLPKVFPANKRSLVVSVAKSWVGVATGVGTAVYVGFFPSEDTAPERLRFLFFVAIVCGMVPILISPVMKFIPENERSSKPLAIPSNLRLPICYGISIALITTTLLSTLYRNWLVSSLLILLVLSPTMLLIPGKSAEVAVAETEALESPTTNLDENNAVADFRSPWESGPFDMIQRFEFYLIFIATFCIQSGGLFVTINTGSIVQSRGNEVNTATAVTIFACFQGFARMVTGFVSDWLVAKKLPRTIVFPILMAFIAAGHLMLSLPGAASLLVGIALCGVGFGSVYPLLVIIIGEVFGKDRVASNYMVFDGAPGAIGVVLIAKFLGGSIYRAHETCDANGENCTCTGDECFRMSHLIIVGVEVLGVALGALLTWRTQIVYAHLRGEGDGYPQAELSAHLED